MRIDDMRRANDLLNRLDRLRDKLRQFAAFSDGRDVEWLQIKIGCSTEVRGGTRECNFRERVYFERIVREMWGALVLEIWDVERDLIMLGVDVSDSPKDSTTKGDESAEEKED